MKEKKSADAQDWLRHAASDLADARKLARGKKTGLNSSSNLCQQAAEKAVKALLVLNGVDEGEWRRGKQGHDISYLIRLAEPFDPNINSLVELRNLLTILAVDARYPPFPPITRGEFDEHYRNAKGFYNHIHSSLVAKKHVDISITVKQIAVRSLPHSNVYIATHRIGKAGQCYQHSEQVSGEEFWGVKAWTTPPPRHKLKDPDVVITQGEQVDFLVEVKWEAFRGSTNTDLLLSPEEWSKMARLLDSSAMCRARGPAVKDGRCHHNPLPLGGEYSINDNTKLVLVSDFLLVKEFIPDPFVKTIYARK